MVCFVDALLNSSTPVEQQLVYYSSPLESQTADSLVPSLWVGGRLSVQKWYLGQPHPDAHITMCKPTLHWHVFVRAAAGAHTLCLYCGLDKKLKGELIPKYTSG